MFCKPQLAITLGEPAGIGVDLFLQLLTERFSASFIVFADPQLILARAKRLNISITFTTDYSIILNGHLCDARIKPINCKNPLACGLPDKENVPYVIETLSQAIHACLNNECQALVTGPIHKAIINDGQIPFSGHTEFLAKQSGSRKTVMLLMNKIFKIALATTHIPLKDVPHSIDKALLLEIIQIIHEDFEKKFRIKNPRITVCGLNPHAGEQGHLGREEIEIIIPALDILREKYHYQLKGPIPADTAFTKNIANETDVYLAMYHDQGLPVLKYADFGESVNITLGLPFIRTSVDHGTALELAGTGKGHSSSFKQAILTAITLSQSIPN